MKAAESWFDSVTCLSGPLSCYRKELILRCGRLAEPEVSGQTGHLRDDRSMTNFILKTHRTGYQDSAICSTIVPSQMKVFLKRDALEALLARVAPGRKLYLAQRAVYGIVFLHRPNRADCRACRGCL